MVPCIGVDACDNFKHGGGVRGAGDGTLGVEDERSSLPARGCSATRQCGRFQAGDCMEQDNKHHSAAVRVVLTVDV